MRRGFVVLALLATMVGLRALQTDGDSGSDPMTLAAIGFVVLAAFAVAELGQRLGLPRVTGYIVSGVALGPFALRVLSNGMVDELKMFSTLALGLIATSAGLELDLRGLRSLARTLAATISIKIVFGVFVVGGVVFAMESAFGLLGAQGTGQSLAIAGVIAALSIGTSPAIALALISETGAKGRLADLVLGAAVVKDVVVVVAIAVAVAAAHALIGGGSIDVSVLGHVGIEIAASSAAGAALGALLIAYLRYVKAEMLLFVAAMVLVVAEVSTALHLELLLVFIAAGVVVRNFSEYEHDLARPLDTVSLPVFIVFFTNAGANVDVAATIGILPMALAVCVLRAGGFALASRLGGRFGGEEVPVRKLAWLGYLPQAGVALGLLGIAVAQLPEIGTQLGTLGMAVIAINLLVGPVTLRTALTRAAAAAEPVVATGPTTADESGTHVAVATRLSDPALREIVATIDRDLRAMATGVVEESLRAWLHHRVQLAEPALSAVASDAGRVEARARTAAVLAAAARLAADDRAPDLERLLAAFDDQLVALQSLPNALITPLDPELAAPSPTDSRLVALRKRAAWVFDLLRLRRRRRTRRVDVRTAARTVVAPLLVEVLDTCVNRAYRAEAEMLDRLRATAAGSTAPTDGAAFVDAFAAQVRGDVEGAATTAVLRLCRLLERLGAPGVASRARYSDVEPEVRRIRGRMATDAEQWPVRRDGALLLLRVTAEIATVEGVLLDAVRDRVIAAADEAIAAIVTESNAEVRRLTAMREVVTAATALPSLDTETRSRLQMSIDTLVPRQVDKRLRAVASELRRSTSESLVTVIQESVAEHAGAEHVVPSLTRLVEAPRPAAAELVWLDVGQTVTGHLSAELLPELEELLAATWAEFATAREAMTHAERAVAYAWERRQAETDETTPLGHLGAEVDGAVAALTPVAARAEAQWSALRERLLATVGGVMPRLLAEIERAGQRSAGPARGGGRVREAVNRLRARVRRAAGPALARLRWLRHEAFGRLGERVRVRSGIDPADAAEIRGSIEATAARSTQLPETVDTAFTLDPVRDPRIFTARRGALGAVLAAEQAWIRDPSAGNGALVVSPTGQGKSSLLRIARFDLASRRVIVVPARARSEQTTLLGYLAHELRCTAEVDPLIEALGRGRATIVVDDIHAWLDISARGLHGLDGILSLVTATRRSAFWLVSVASEALEAIEIAVRVRSTFARVLRLDPLDATTLGTAIEARLRQTALDVEYPTTWSRRWFGRSSPKDAFVAALSAGTHGNLRGAIAQWRRLARVDGPRIHVEAPRGQWGLPVLRQFTGLQLAVLVLLLRAGPRGVDEVIVALAVPRASIEREVGFLLSAGLIEEREDRLEVRSQVRDEVAAALVEFGALGGSRR